MSAGDVMLVENDNITVKITGFVHEIQYTPIPHFKLKYVSGGDTFIAKCFLKATEEEGPGGPMVLGTLKVGDHISFSARMIYGELLGKFYFSEVDSISILPHKE